MNYPHVKVNGVDSELSRLYYSSVMIHFTSFVEDGMAWYVILAIVLGSLVVLGLFIVIIVFCVMHLNKRDRRRDYPQHYGDRDRMMYDNRSRGRDTGVINRSAGYPGKWHNWTFLVQPVF